jgi:hypothetical protein
MAEPMPPGQAKPVAPGIARDPMEAAWRAPGPDAVLPVQRPQALVDVLDQLLQTGVVLDGHIMVSVAGVDLVQIGLRALLASVDSAARLLAPGRPA